ncbi:hypothetical protein SAMN05216474_2307 [Lishizhenia tianjinensis]|uniref:ISXO2-like transposase domain-containing protein n=2 Tax=Lishizhenia tianjinensis TaxID=477690 RepID=A0A1I7AQC0_9FLAO|nr:hypothetical protein SAMN05216474_2307 [Lishizhenia tianjinensis]
MLTFMKNSKATYKEWLYAIYFILDAKKPMSNKELQRKLGCKHYKKVYYMSMKIRYEISKINDRLVFSLCKKLPAMDELKIKDGKLHALPKNSRLYFSSQNKVKLLRFKLSLMKCIEIKNKLLDKPFNNSFPKLYKATEICPIACENNISNTTCVLNERMDKILQHNVNRIIEGIHHGVSLLHLQVYLDEFTFKYNHRKYQIPKYELFFKKCELGNYRPT